ncbi:MAG: fibronectin type III domain-containing protein, partial [Paludibacteraceae bacterium]|nr:fibronectin type III domain-containing protein [Paludibacteraceae bacterium]
ISKKQADNPDDLTAEDILARENITGRKSLDFKSDDAVENTVYYVYIRSTCTGGAYGEWTPATRFKTTCPERTLEEYGQIRPTASDLSCWTLGIREPDQLTTAPSSSTTYARSLYMQASTTSDGAYAIMPPLKTDDISKLQLSFNAGTASTAASNVKRLTVGIVTNPSDLSTFVPVKTIDYAYYATKDSLKVMRYTVRFDNYKGDYNDEKGNSPMFLLETGTATGYVNIFNIKYDTIASCPEPVDIIIDSIAGQEVRATWDGNADKYQLQVLQDNTVVFDKIISGNSSMVDGLAMLSSYELKVRAICGADTSAWSNARQFTTECPAGYPLPYTQDFEGYTSGSKKDIPDCWEQYYNGQSGTSAQFPYVYTTAKHNGKNGYYVGNANRYGNSYAVLPRFAQDVNTAVLTFWYKAQSTAERRLAIGVADSASTREELERTLVIFDTISAKSGQGFLKYERALDDQKDGARYIVLIGFHGNGTANSTTAGGMYIDDISVDKIPTCFTPGNISVFTYSTGTLGVKWTRHPSERIPAQHWDVAIVPTGADISTGTVTTVDTQEYIFKGLDASTTYDIYVRSNCGNGDVSEWGMTTGTTGCLVDIEDAHWDFDDASAKHPTYTGAAATYIIDNCWNSTYDFATTAANIPYTRKNANYRYSRSGSYALYLNTTAALNGAYAVLPEINADYDSLQIRFWVRASEHIDTTYYDEAYRKQLSSATKTAKVSIGTLTEPMNPATYEELTVYTTPVPSAEFVDKDPAGNDFWTEVVVPLYGAKGKYIAIASTVSNAANSFNVDDVVIERLADDCMAPTAITLDEESYQPGHAELTWHSNGSKWSVTIRQNNNVVDSAVVTQQKYVSDKIAISQSYDVTVETLCDGKTNAATAVVTAPCLPFIKEQASWNMDKNLVAYTSAATNYANSTTYVIPNCFDAGTWTASAVSNTYRPYAIKSSTSIKYGHGPDNTTDNRALRFYAYNNKTNAYYNHFLAMPELNVDYDSTVLHFYYRAAQMYSPTYDDEALQSHFYANSKYNKKLYIGTSTDLSTMDAFTVLDSLEYPYTFENNQVSAKDYDDEGWIEATISLKKYKDKGRIVLMYGMPNGTAANYMFIDDISIVDATFCSKVSAVNILPASDNITLTWAATGSQKVHLQVASARDFSEESLLFDQDVEGDRQMVGGLIPNTQYYYRIKHLCSETEESDYIDGSVWTAYAVKYFEDFDISTAYPDRWSRYSGLLEDVVDGKNPLAVVAETSVEQWRSQPDRTKITGATMQTYFKNNAKKWLVTPNIDITKFTGDKLMLSFDLFLRGADDYPADTANATSERFCVLVSTDNGKTWRKDDIVTWDNLGLGQHNLSEVSFNGTTCYVDMTKHAGNVVKIAFYAGNTGTGSNNYLYLDNVQLNTYTETNNSATICQYEDYSDASFTLDESELNVGLNDFERFTPSRTTAPDKLEKLELVVTQAVETVLYGKTCAGETYQDDATHFNVES